MSGADLGGKICKIAESNAASTVICGSEGKGALGRVFLGTTSGSVLSKCRCSVLVVKAGEKYQTKEGEEQDKQKEKVLHASSTFK